MKRTYSKSADLCTQWTCSQHEEIVRIKVIGKLMVQKSWLCVIWGMWVITITMKIMYYICRNGKRFLQESNQSSGHCLMCGIRKSHEKIVWCSTLLNVDAADDGYTPNLLMWPYPYIASVSQRLFCFVFFRLVECTWPHSAPAMWTFHQLQAVLKNKLKLMIQAKEEAPQAASYLEQDVVLQPTPMIWTLDLPPDHHSPST